MGKSVTDEIHKWSHSIFTKKIPVSLLLDKLSCLSLGRLVKHDGISPEGNVSRRGKIK
jgi:hypothetical protein